MKITFLGGAEVVTGSKYLVEHEDTKVLIDCGLFQGGKELRTRNWEDLPIKPSEIDAVVLTHAHIDHSGYVPLLVKNGFKGPIYCSEATFELCSILLIDSGYLQEEDAKRAVESGSPNPELPLYTENDAERSLKSFKSIQYDREVKIGGSLKVTLIKGGHILGSSFVIISDGKEKITFSGDLGRPNQPIMKAPSHLKQTDYLVVESTYGNRLHEEADPENTIGEIINRTVAKGGVLIIPAFAIGRSQMILYYLYQLRQKKIIPKIPIFLDSPMAISVTDLLCKFKEEHKLSPDVCADVCAIATYTRTVEESMQINRVKGSAIIISASGMATGGRVLHHLRHFISHSKNTVLFVGYQASGTGGRALVDGAKEIEIHDKSYKVKAEVKILDSLSAHADYNEVLEWLSHFETSPKKVFITHGEIEAAQAMKMKIEERFGWSAIIPKYLESFTLE